jgi:hypothetical protein
MNGSIKPVHMSPRQQLHAFGSRKTTHSKKEEQFCTLMQFNIKKNSAKKNYLIP